MNKELYTERNYKKGAMIWIENSKAMPYFFIVKSGQLRQSQKIMSEEEGVVLNPGDTIGLIACFTGQDYLNRLVALTDSVVIMIRKENIISFLSKKHDIFLKIVSDYSNRLRLINNKLFSLCSDSIYSELPEKLLEIADYFKKMEQRHNYIYALTRYLEIADDEEHRKKVKRQLDAAKKRGDIIVREPEKIGSHAVYKSGDIVFLEQERGGEFYLVERGRVKISHIDRDKEFIVAILKEGEIFGEMAILNQVCRNATATAFEETRLLVLSKENFLNTLGTKILQKVFTSLAQRMWYSYRRALNLSYKNPVTRLYDCLDFIIKSKEGREKSLSYYYDISMTDLRVMTNTSDVDDELLKEFLNDQNIRLSYGSISIVNMAKFNSSLKRYLSRETSGSN